MAMNNKVVRWIVVGGVAAAAAAGVLYWKAMQSKLPAGIASGNGRLEAKLVDIAAKEPLKVKEVLVDEGALVKPGDVLVKLDTVTLDAELAAANAAVAAAKERLTVAEASIGKQKQEIALAESEASRSQKMLEQRASSQQEVDIRNTKVGTTKAQLAEVAASLETAKRQVDVALANAATIQTRIDDATLKSPVTGRVLYRLAEPGEVLAAGGKVLTIVNLEDIYMEIFLPSEEAASVKLGSEGRITVDYAPDRSIAGLVTFVSPQAQFTPKQVETKSERDKLMFRVKIQLPKDIAPEYLDRIKTGVRGVGYVKLEPEATWPTWLNNVIALR
ncbi:MAG TPA: HlyD family efflux transporter periplasmic adaptor subunit [Polyangiales bacterium]|nr:HlyD family efflux transporter periplasmic adaptor subunit [Polyangiales bacterium]